ncbi:MAG: LSM domain-containing protein [Candidatus Diapherotrites archaeon]
MNIDKPFDFLNQSKNKDVLVVLKGDLQFRGKLKAFDVHMNIVLDEAEQLENGESKKKYGQLILRGDNILFLSP